MAASIMARGASLTAEALHSQAVLHFAAIEAHGLPAADLNGFSDPYVIFTLGEHKYKTPIIFKSLNPVWNENIYDRMIVLPGLDAVLHAEVFDHDTIGRDDFLGMCDVELAGLIDQMVHTLRLKLSPKKQKKKEKDLGELTLKVQLTFQVRGEPNVAIPEGATLQHFASMAGLLVNSDTEVAIRPILKVCGESIHCSLLRVLQAEGCASQCVALLNEILDVEIQRVEDGVSLFRTDSAATKLFHTYFVNCGSNFLKQTLTLLIHGVCSMDPFELECDPHRTSPEQLEKNLTFIFRIARIFMISIFDSANLLPIPIRHILVHVSQAVEAKWGSGTGYSGRAISSLFLLRLICPAIYIPESVGLHAPPNEPARRALKLISKIMLSLSNGAAGVSDDMSFVTHFEDFMELYRDDLIIFLTKAVTDVPMLIDNSLYVVPEATRLKDFCWLYVCFKKEYGKLTAQLPKALSDSLFEILRLLDRFHVPEIHLQPASFHS